MSDRSATWQSGAGPLILNDMPIFGLIALVVVACLIIYAVEAWKPPAPWRSVIYGVLVLLLLLWLLLGLGMLPQGSGHWKL